MQQQSQFFGILHFLHNLYKYTSNLYNLYSYYNYIILVSTRNCEMDHTQTPISKVVTIS